MEQWGNNSTYNLETVLKQNIVASDYYTQTCQQLANWSEVVDEIYETVDHVEPWMSGNARGPSTAFCLLHRLFTLKLSIKEIRDTITHPDSPYIRAVGFLYLRYVADPKSLWGWCAPYVKDAEKFAPSPAAGEITMGDFVRDILLGQYYFETIFPRIPKLVADNIADELKSRGLNTTAKGNGGTGGADRRGTETEGNRRPASVKASLSVAFGQRAPNRAGTREEGRGRDPSLRGGSSSAPASTTARASRSPESHRDRDRDRGRDDRDRGRDDRYRSSGRDKERERDRDRDRRDRSRSRERERERDRDRDYRDRDRDKDRDRDRDRERDRERDRDRDRDYYRDRR